MRARIIESTLQLLLDQSPADLTLRQIAQHAKCHHPDIATYFGGKLGFYSEVLPHAVATMAARGLPQTFDQLSSTLTRTAQTRRVASNGLAAIGLLNSTVLHPFLLR